MLLSSQREFFGDPVVRTARFHWGDVGSIPGWGNQIPQAVPCSQKEKVCKSVYSATTNQLDNWLSEKEGRERGRKEGRKREKEKGKRKPSPQKRPQRKEKPWLKLNLPTSVVSLLPLWPIQVTNMMSLNVNSWRDMTTGYTIMCIIASSVADSLVCILVILCNNCSEFRRYFNIALLFSGPVIQLSVSPRQFPVHKNMWPCVVCFKRKSEIGDSPWKCLLDSLVTRTCVKGSFCYHFRHFCCLRVT